MSVISHDISKINAAGSARIAKLDVEMFQDEFWKASILASEGQRSRSRVAKKHIAGVGLCTLVRDSLF